MLRDPSTHVARSTGPARLSLQARSVTCFASHVDLTSGQLCVDVWVSGSCQSSFWLCEASSSGSRGGGGGAGTRAPPCRPKKKKTKKKKKKKKEKTSVSGQRALISECSACKSWSCCWSPPWQPRPWSVLTRPWDSSSQTTAARCLRGAWMHSCACTVLSGAEERGVDGPSLDRSYFSRLQPISFLFYNPSSSHVG